MCQLGTCAHDGSPCESDRGCGLDDEGREVECLPLPDNCHDHPLVNADLGLDFDPPGPAGSPRACNQAKRNDCDLFECDDGDEDDGDDRGPGRGRGGDKGDKGGDRGRGGGRR